MAGAQIGGPSYTLRVCKILLMAIRKQIIVPDDVDARLRRLASERGLSQSALIVEAIRALPDASEQLARTLAFAGSVKGGSSKLSEEVDDALYGATRPA